jgi:hypothetical protein
MVDVHADGMALACHAERQRSISRGGHRDASLTLSMTGVANSFFFARCAKRAICWNQCPRGRPAQEAHSCLFLNNYKP